MFNPTHASHMEGSWERMVGVARCILDSPLLDVKNLTHDLLATLMAQISSIVNVRPLTPRTTLPPCPFLTEKSTYQKEWPVGKIVKAYPSSDNCVCKTDVRVGSDRRNHTRPTTDIVFLCRKDCESEWTCFVFKTLHSLDYFVDFRWYLLYQSTLQINIVCKSIFLMLWRLAPPVFLFF